jgi:hypothetical protein
VAQLSGLYDWKAAAHTFAARYEKRRATGNRARTRVFIEKSRLLERRFFSLLFSHSPSCFAFFLSGAAFVVAVVNTQTARFCCTQLNVAVYTWSRAKLYKG